MTNLELEWKGLMPFLEAERLQKEELHFRRENQGSALVLGLEHPAVITLGKRAKETVDLCDSVEVLTEFGLPVVRTDRGGQATLHSPGQLVIYPILPVAPLGGVRQVVRVLLESTQEMLKTRYDLSSDLNLEQAGLYHQGRKLVFCGLRIEGGWSRHGLSLNVNNDLRLFGKIRPCGHAGASLTSLSELGLQTNPEEAFDSWSEVFARRIMPCVDPRFPAISSFRSWSDGAVGSAFP